MKNKPWLGSIKNKVWLHNSFLGYAKLTQKNMEVIETAPTATKASQAIAGQIAELSKQLYESLKVRVK